ncbi:hypothetical protein IKP85_04975 [bacterium]|nr:hypothetical protein [bacterium]
MENNTIINEENYLRLYYDIPFEGSTSAGKPLRKLRNITCPYRGIKIIPGTALKPFERGLANCKTASEAVTLLSDYSDNLLPTEKSVYAILKDFAKLNPDDNIQNCLQMLYTNSLTRLKLEEFCVLDDVDSLSCKLSPSTAIKLREKTTLCRQLILSDNKKDTFKRKAFLNSLDEINPKENEKEIFGDIKNKALFLPTSGSSKHAFIVKYASRTHTEAVRRIFIASTGSIEHIVPQSMGGLNTIGNFLWTTASGNRFRENMPLLWYIKRFPKIPNYAQMYIDDVIREIHNGKLEGNETYPYKIKQKLLEASEGRILISLSGYKYTEQDAAEAEKEYHYRWEKFNKNR